MNKVFSHYFKLLVGVSLIIISAVLVLSLIKKKVHVCAEIEASAVSFEVLGQVDNFLGINNNSQSKYNLKVFSFDKAEIPYSNFGNDDASITDDKEGEIILISNDDESASLSLNDASIGMISLQNGNRVNIKAIKSEANRVRIDLQDYNKEIEFISREPMFTLKPRKCSFTFAKSDSIFESENLLVTSVQNKAITATPKDNSLSLRIEFEKNSMLEENDVIPIKNLRFYDMSEAGMHSYILSGTLNIIETDKQVSFGKNKTILFNALDKFDITDLVLYGDRVKITFEGETRQMVVGFAENSYVPSLLEYLYKNNFLIILFNSYLIVLTFFISLFKTNKESKAEENNN